MALAFVLSMRSSLTAIYTNKGSRCHAFGFILMEMWRYGIIRLSIISGRSIPIQELNGSSIEFDRDREPGFFISAIHSLNFAEPRG